MEREKTHDRNFLDSLDIYGAFINNILWLESPAHQ